MSLRSALRAAALAGAAAAVVVATGPAIASPSGDTGSRLPAGPVAGILSADSPSAAPVVLSAGLAQPQPGDSAATLRVRHQLADLIGQAEADQQRYDAANATYAAAQADLAAAKAREQAAALAEARTQDVLNRVIVADYMSGATTAPSLLALATAPDPSALLYQLQASQQLEAAKADDTAAAIAAADASTAARAAFATALVRANAARDDANAALAAGQRSVAAAADLVRQAHLSDVATEQSTAVSPHEAAAALRAQAEATRAATASMFRGARSDAAVISIAAGALLQQAVGDTRAPADTLPGIPAYRRATDGPVDEQAVMGPAPHLGRTVHYAGPLAAAGTVSHALEPYDGTVVTDGWPSAGVGLAVKGTAKPLKPNGVTVQPVIPAPVAPRGKSVLRAQVAVAAALAELGTPYVWDAAGPNTFDCSGLTLWAWEHAGVSLTHYTATQVLQGVPVAANQLLPGDLILFGTQLHHVGLYLGAGFMIDAPTTGEYVKIQRVSDNGDFAIAVRP